MRVDYLVDVACDLSSVQDDLPVCKSDEVRDQHSNHRLDIVALCRHEIRQKVSVGSYDWRVLVGPSNLEKSYHEIFHLGFESAAEIIRAKNILLIRWTFPKSDLGS